MKKIFMQIVVLLIVFPLAAQNDNDYLTLEDIKDKYGYDYETGYTEPEDENDNEYYYIAYKWKFEFDNQELIGGKVFFFEENKSTAKFIYVTSNLPLEHANSLIRHFNKNYVKREGSLIWDDYEDNTSVLVIFNRKNGLVHWLWE